MVSYSEGELRASKGRQGEKTGAVLRQGKVDQWKKKVRSAGHCVVLRSRVKVYAFYLFLLVYSLGL